MSEPFKPLREPSYFDQESRQWVKRDHWAALTQSYGAAARTKSLGSSPRGRPAQTIHAAQVCWAAHLCMSLSCGVRCRTRVCRGGGVRMVLRNAGLSHTGPYIYIYMIRARSETHRIIEMAQAPNCQVPIEEVLQQFKDRCVTSFRPWGARGKQQTLQSKHTVCN